MILMYTASMLTSDDKTNQDILHDMHVTAMNIKCSLIHVYLGAQCTCDFKFCG